MVFKISAYTTDIMRHEDWYNWLNDGVWLQLQVLGKFKCPVWSLLVELQGSYSRQSFLFSMAQRLLMCNGLLTTVSSRPHSAAPHTATLLQTNDQPDADLYLTTHNTFGGNRALNPNKQAVADPCLTQPNLSVIVSAKLLYIWFYPKHKRMGHFEFENMCRNFSKPLYWYR